jgi:hypothetical protein
VSAAKPTPPAVPVRAAKAEPEQSAKSEPAPPPAPRREAKAEPQGTAKAKRNEEAAKPEVATAEPEEKPKRHAKPAPRHKEVRREPAGPRVFRAGSGNSPTFFGLLR